ncbi:MAG TPA: molecular chaperone TorD family protein [Blastocatellia bacterium]|nr:molecular chaperone TorD family protein [Blastocatellia bacterium]
MKPLSSKIETRQHRLLREAAEWRLISLLFDRPSEVWRKQVAELSNGIGDETLKLAAQAAQREATEGFYHSIFGPGGPAPAREVSYCDLVQPGQLMAELSGYYDAFAYAPDTAEVIDHVSIEAGFIGYLRLKEAYALECGDTSHAEVTAEAAELFLCEHLSRIAEPLANALVESGSSYLVLAGSALLLRTGPRKDKPARAGLPVLEDAEDGSFQCGEV